MKIAKVEQFYPGPRARLVKITTDNGLVGWGESTLEGRARSGMAAVAEIGDYLIGKDPLRIEHHWQHVYRSAFLPMIIAGLTGGSLVARAAGLRKVGIALSGAGFGLMLVSGGLGALVAYKLGAVTQAQKAIEGEAPKAKPEAGRAEETGEGGARRAPQRAATDGAFVRS